MTDERWRAVDIGHAGDAWIARDDERFVEVGRKVGPLGADVLLRRKRGQDDVGDPQWFGPLARTERGIYEKCIDSDDGRQTSPGNRCRECDIAYLVAGRKLAGGSP